MPHRFIPPPGLKKRPCFLRVQGKGQRFRGAHLLVMVAPHDGLSRVGYTVSRRVGNAVVRNGLRRRLKEIVRLANGSLKPNTDYVVIAFPTAAKRSTVQLRQELLCLLKRVLVPKKVAAPPPVVCLPAWPSTG